MSATMPQTMTGADVDRKGGACECGTWLTADVELLTEHNGEGLQYWCCPDCWRRLIKVD